MAVSSVGFINSDFVHGDDAVSIPLMCRRSRIVQVVEAKGLDLTKFVPAGWTTLQDRSSPARAGSAILLAPGIEVLANGWDLGSKPFIGGKRIKMLTRWTAWAIIAEGDGECLVVASHWPKKLFRALQPGHTRRVRQTLARHRYRLLGADFNGKPGPVAKALGLSRVYSNGIVGIAANFPIGKRGAFRIKGSDHPVVFASATIPTAPEDPVPDLPTDPYAHVVCNGKPLDVATTAAIREAEATLGYPLTILQGIGGAAASAGTHLEGRCVDLVDWDSDNKLRVFKDLGFFGWRRAAIPGLWGAHLHCGLILNSRDNQRGIAPAGFRQIASFDDGRDGLKDNAVDPTYRPDPKVEFHYPPKKEPVPVVRNNVTRARDALASAMAELSRAGAMLDKTPEDREVAQAAADECKALEVQVRKMLHRLPKH